MNGYKFIKPEDELMGDLTQGTSPQIAPVPPPAIPAPAIPPVSVSPVKPPPRIPAEAPITDAPASLPGMPPSITVNDLEDYFNKQKSSLDKFGPEDQMAQQDATNARRNSFGYKATEGAKGFADALMMGVARAGDPGFRRDFVNQENQMAQENMNALRGANEANINRTNSNMAIDRMNPGSDLSKIAQQSYAPLFEKLGYEPGALEKMSAANIESALALMAQYGGKQIEAMIRQFEADFQRQQFDETLRHNRVTEGAQAADDRRNAAAEILKRDSIIPFKGPSGETVDAAKKVFEDQVTGGASGFIKTATNKKTGERMGTRDGKTWEPIQ